MSNTKVSFWRIFFPSLIAGIVLCILFFILFSGMIGALLSNVEPSYSVKENTILHLQLKGEINEISKSEFNLSSIDVSRNLGLADLQFGLKKAAKDERIKGVFIELSGANCGYTTASDIRKAIKEFEQSGKFVVAYNRGEVVTLKEYYIASAATENYGFHSSMFEFLGLGGELMFYKGLFDKLDLKVQIVRGPNNVYKSAVEPYFRKNLSDSGRYQMQVYLNNIWTTVKNRISEDRGIAATILDKIADSSLATRLYEAKKYNLVDSLMYRDEVLQLLAHKIEADEIDDLEFEDFRTYATKYFEKNQNHAYTSKANIAVIIAEGGISVDGDGISSRSLIKKIHKAQNDKSIKGVILRVNSPGGSALASEEIWRALSLTNEVKPVIVSMGDVAASGGYYIATASRKIFAEKTTITGSIGVFGIIPYTGDFLTNKLGITFDRVSTNPHAVLSTNRPLTPQELNTIQKGVEQTYNQFLQRVADSRKMPVASVNKIAKGRVWTGSDALRIGLVDTLGGLPDAIAYFEKTLSLKKAIVRFYPRVKIKPWMEALELINKNAKIEQAEIPQEIKAIYHKMKKVKEITGIQMRMAYPTIK